MEPEQTGKGRFVALDGLRGFCALIVAVLHLYDFGKVAPPAFIHAAFIFVDFFFILSGFVIAHAYGQALASGDGSLRFFIRRFGRLYPLHAFVLMMFLVVEAGKAVTAQLGGAVSVPPFSDATSVGALIGNIALVHSLGLFDRLTWNLPSWSISVEFYTNLAYGLMFVGVCGWRRIPYGAKALVLAGLGLGASLWFVGEGRVMTFDTGIFRCFYGFFLGTLVEWVWRRVPRLRLGRAVFTVLELAALAVTYQFAVSFSDAVLLILAPPLFALFVWLFAHEGGAVSRLLTTGASAKIGELSYSIYLVHEFLIINGFGRLSHFLAAMLPATAGSTVAGGGAGIGALLIGGPASLVLTMVIYVAGVVATSVLTYRYIEVPTRRWFNAQAKRLAIGRQDVTETALFDKGYNRSIS